MSHLVPSWRHGFVVLALGIAASCTGVEAPPQPNKDCVEGTVEPCYDGDASMLGVGPCREGEHVCQGGVWQACEGQRLPLVEVPNGVDDDCNGIVDEGFDYCGTTMSLPCYFNEAGETIACPGALPGACKCGEMTCVNNKFGPCTGAVLPKFEMCDGVIDDDCDGIVDDIGLPGALCHCLLGDVDICYTGPPETVGVGPCTLGTRSCMDGKWGICKGQVLPTPELCNLVDDDCDGTLDNGTFCCPDGVVSGDETDVDCGGSCAEKCPVGKACKVAADCVTNLCNPMTLLCE